MKHSSLLGLVPLVLYLGAFTLVPVVSTLVLSFHTPEGHWGLGAFRALAAHYQFGEAVVNTLAITGLGLLIELSLGLAAAAALAGRCRGQGLVRVLLLIPLGAPTIVAASTMRYVFGMVGYLNEVLYRLGLVTLPIDWTGSRWLAVVTVAMADAWKVTPLVMLILLAGLQAIPRELYEAARTDGAGPWQQFWRITLPLLRPALTMAFIIRGVDAFRIFALPLALPGLVVCGLLVWLLSWEEFTLATYLTLGAKTMPLQVYYYLYQGNWFDTAVAATLMTAPVLVLSAFLQRYLRETSLAGVMR